jgi:anthranilate phosphoribosyltransferase
MHALLNGELDGSSNQAILDFVLLNSAALLFVAGKASTLPDAVNLARQSIKDGKAKAALQAFIRATADK